MMERELPEGWETLPFEEIIELVIGGDWGKDPDEDLGTDFQKVACIRGSEIKNWKRDKGSSAAIRLVKTSSLETRQLQVGDILLEISGGGPDQPVGRTLFIDENVFLNHQDLPKVCSNFMRLVRLTDFADKSFINQYLQYFYHSGEVVNYQGGSNNLRNLKFKEYSKIEVPLPPLAEQKRIVAKLDEAFQHLDTLKAKLERIPALLKTFRQAVLTQAVTGKLTEEWRERNHYDAKEDIKKLKEGRQLRYKQEFEIALSNGGRKPKKILFDECQEEPLVESWQRVFIEEIFDVETGGTPRRDVNKFWENGNVPWIKSGQVSNRDITEVDEYITEIALNETNAKLYPVNSILIALYGEGKTRGQVGILKFNATSNQAVAAMVNPSLAPETIQYIFYYGLSQYEEIRKEAAGGNQPNLNVGKIRKWVLNFPPLEEQKEIVKKVEALFAKADALEAAYGRVKAKVDQLPQALLAKAFRGELVPQDPHDEPARVLLEKIKAAHASTAKPAKGKKTKGDKQTELAL